MSTISRLGRFEVQAEVGRGGFGQVFRAFDPIMNREVAVKVLTATEDAGSFIRFKNEATAAGNLHHENIVTVYEFGQEGRIPFLVMEYLNGEDLQHVIKNRQLTLYQKVRIMDQVADGLHCAHRNGVLHRDVKPANIMVLGNGAVKIMDFGIARLMRDDSTRLTQQGYMIGTVVYMAPELFSGTAVELDALCDIWSYGVVMYELLAGKNPFQTGSMQSEMYRIVHSEPAPLPTNECPPELQAVINRLLARPRHLRYQSLEDTRFDLQPILKNLEKAEADRLVSHAEHLMFQQQLDEALEAARKARKTDPQNGSARIIFERIQDEKRKQSLLPQVDDLLRRGNEAAEQRNLTEGITHLKTALQLDSTNQKVLARLQELRILKVRMEEAARLATEAGEEFQEEALTDAFAHASEAIALDPNNGDAQRLLENIQRAMQTRELERAVGAEILRARGLLAINDPDGAMEALKAAESKCPGRSDVRELTSKAAQLIAGRGRSQEFSRLLDQAKDLLRTARFEDAIKELEQLRQAYPNEGEAADLLAFAKQESKGTNRSEEVKRIAGEATELNGKQCYLDSIRILEDGLKEYPDELVLKRLLRSTYLELQNFERACALQAGLERCQDLQRRARWQEALDLIALLTSDNPDNQELGQLAAEVNRQKIQAERAGAMRSAVDQAEKLLRDNHPDVAASVLEVAILAFGSQPELTALLKKAKESQQSLGDRQYVEAELKHAMVFEERGEIATSLKIIDGALHRFPQSPELLAARERLGALQSRAGNEQLTPEDWAKARVNLDETRKLFPSDMVFAQLDEEQERLRRDRVPGMVREGRRLLEAGQVEDAEQFLSANLLEFSDSPDVMKLASDIGTEKKLREKQKDIAECFRAVRERESKSDLTGAQNLLLRALVSYPNDPDLENAHRKLRDRLKRDGKTLTQTNDTTVAHGPVLPAAKWRIFAIAGMVVAGLALLAFWMMHPTIRVAPEKLSFAYKAGASPELKTLTVSGGNDIPDPKRSEKWVTFTRRSESAGKVEFLVGVSADGLGPGTHTADLVFASQKVPVEVVVPSVRIDFRPASLVFSYASGGTPAQKIVVTSPEEIPDPKPNEGWVTFTRRNSGPGKAEFDVRVSANGLAPGPHAAFLVFAADKKVPVQLVIPGGSTLEVTPSFLAFPGGGPQQRIILTGPGVLPDPKPSAPWVSVTRSNVSTGKAEFLVQVSSEGAEPGKKYANLVFSPDRKVTVELTVPGGPGAPSTLEVEPDSLSFPGGGTQQSISASAPAAIADPVSTDPWVTFTRLDPEPGKAEFLVQALPAGLAPGPHVAYLTFNKQKQVRIELTVAAPKPLNVQPAELRFKYKRGGPAPQPQTITATGSEIPEPTKKAPWIQLTRNNSGAQAEFVVQILPEKLGSDSNIDDLIFSPQKRVRIVALLLEAPETAPARSGTLFWSGATLNPGDELWLKEKRVLKGSGTVNGSLPKADAVVDRSKLPASVRVVEEPSQDNGFVLRLQLVSGPPVYYLEIPWTVKK
jgi:serine/threonine protein kinase